MYVYTFFYVENVNPNHVRALLALFNKANAVSLNAYKLIYHIKHY